MTNQMAAGWFAVRGTKKLKLTPSGPKLSRRKEWPKVNSQQEKLVWWVKCNELYNM